MGRHIRLSSIHGHSYAYSHWKGNASLFTEVSSLYCIRVTCKFIQKMIVTYIPTYMNLFLCCIDCIVLCSHYVRSFRSLKLYLGNIGESFFPCTDSQICTLDFFTKNILTFCWIKLIYIVIWKQAFSKTPSVLHRKKKMYRFIIIWWWVRAEFPF